MASTSSHASDTAYQSYEQLPYESGPHYPTHPDCTATVATLMGMHPADVATARVLELGCGNGGNVIPMAAALPHAHFLGFDLSPRQVEQGQRLIRCADLDNVELQAADLLDLDDELGCFDFIICHGVYSWVPAAVREKILSICQRSLAPQGVAYISYNTYPGWHFRSIVKDMLYFHTRHLEKPQERLAESRGLLNFLVESIPDSETPYARVLRSEAEAFQRDPDYYLVHEFLDEVNQPFYFYQFMEAAASKGMQFVAEAWSHTRTDDLPPAVNRQIRDISPDLLHVEQYLDFLRRRTFRRTLLCHDNVSLSRSPTTDQVMNMFASHLAMPMEHADLPAGTVRYRTAGGQAITTNHPALQAVFTCLWERHPHVVPVKELLVHARAALPQEPPLATCADGDLIGLFLKCFLANALLLHVHPPCFATELSARPCATRLSRAQARLGLPVANLWHRHMELNELDRHVLSRLDGEHDRACLVTELRDAVEQGTMTAELLRSAAPDLPWPEPGQDLGDFIDVSLQRLFSHAFLLS